MRTDARVVPVSGWRDAVSSELADGAGFAGAWTSREGPDALWRAAFVVPDGRTRVLTCKASDAVPSIVDLVPAADWDEREARDLAGLLLDGREAPRALATHPLQASNWMTSVEGAGVHQVAVGPVHAGVIESGHFRFHVVGERILAMDSRLFYKHRGLERAARGLPPEDGLALAGRACAACSVTNCVAYVQAVEEATDLWPDSNLRRGRTLLLELERLYNHLHDIGAICAGVGLAPGTSAFATLKDRAQRVNERLTGHRFLFGSVAVGGGVAAVEHQAALAARDELRDLRSDAATAWRELEFAGSLQARLDGIGVLNEGNAQRLGASGPAARAAGVRVDARSQSPRLAYDGEFNPGAPRVASGDVAARLEMRATELEVTFEILEDLLAGPIPAGTTATAAGGAQQVGTSRVESPRGATLAVVEMKGDRLERFHLRTGSYANWPALTAAVVGDLLPDFPLINKSFELCYACVDR